MSLELIAEACKKLQDDKDPLLSYISYSDSWRPRIAIQEPRFPSGVEERMRLLHEAGLHHLDASIHMWRKIWDFPATRQLQQSCFGTPAKIDSARCQDLQRQQELLASGAASTARLVGISVLHV